MRLVTLFLFLCLSIQVKVIAQRDGSIRGYLLDTVIHQPISDATVTILDARDSTLVSFSRSLSSGRFRVGGLDSGNYRLLITHIGYHTLSRNFMITGAIRDPDIGQIILTDKSSLLTEVTIEGMAAPVAIRHDTVEYNAGSFRIKPDAVVEDLLKKLPGIQVDKNGIIKANGEEVKKVLVDGKEFFGNDPKIASKNLPADAVDKVQVFDKKSDQSQFSGFDDGNSQKTINLTIKKDRKNGLFGRLTAAGGTDVKAGEGLSSGASYGDGTTGDTRYEHKFNLNQFAGSRQLSVLGMANNTNKQGFSFQDVLGFSGGMGGPGNKGINQGGPDPFSSCIPIQGLADNTTAITTTLAGGLNFNDTWRRNTELSGSYFYNRAEDRTDQRETRQYLLPGNSFTQDRDQVKEALNKNQRLALISDHQLDSSNSIKINTSFIFQNSRSSSTIKDSSWSDYPYDLLNEGASHSSVQATGYDWTNSALFRHRFSKKGRTLSANLSLAWNSRSGDGSLYSVNRYSKPGNVDSAVTLDQVYDLSGKGNNFGFTLSYTEPLSKRSLFEFSTNLYQSHSTSDRKTFDADAGGKYTRPNVQLTNAFKNIYTYQREGIRFRHQQQKFNITIGAFLQEANSANRLDYLSADSSLHTAYVNLLPEANFHYEFNRYRNLRIFYTTHTNQPATTQLQPVPDNSDPLNITVGNPGLKQEYEHSLHLNYISFDPFRRTSFFAMLKYRGIHNRIVSDDQIGQTGSRVSKPVNLNGLYTANGNISWGFPVRTLKSNLNLNSTISYDHTASLVNRVRNNGNNWALAQEAQLNFLYKEIWDITWGVNLQYNDVRYSLQPGQNQHYWTTNYNLDLNVYLPKGFSIASDLDYIRRSGLPADYNSSPLVWNAGIAKKVFKSKKAEARLQVFDILRQNTGFSRNTNQNFIDNISYKVIRQYWLLSLTFQISRFAGKAVQGGMEGKADIKIIR
ncbi:TonB-dependent receptor [Flavitalea flava]